MEQHQVPQHIASYEFHLIGDMTLKQFFQVATGGLVALAVYASPIPGIIKWPIILVSGLFGVALAFLPLEERPLATWVILFLKGIYSPTFYKKAPTSTVDIFAPETAQAQTGAVGTPQAEETKKYLETPASTDQESGLVISSFEERERSFLQKVLSVFQQIPIPLTNKPHVYVEESVAFRQPGIQIPRLQMPNITSFDSAQDPRSPTAPPPTGQVWAAPPTQEASQMPSFATSAGPSMPAPQPISPSIALPQTITTPAHFVITASPPLTPQTPNVVVGQVVDEIGNGVASAILEIRDSQGRPARALRTNTVGHFLTATPLSPGAYQIIVEKDGYEFGSINFAVNDELIHPIEIQGKKISQN